MARRWQDAFMALLAGGILIAATRLSPGEAHVWFRDGRAVELFCVFRHMTGFDCPTCGLTRSLVALMHRDFAMAFTMHPIGPLFALGLCVVIVSVLGRSAQGRPPLWTDRCFGTVLGMAGLAFVLIWIVRLSVRLTG